MASQPQPEKRLLRIKPAATYLGICPWRLRRIVASGDLPVIRLDDHAAWLLDVRDLDRWIEGNKETL
jgi:hypothetical protein